MSARDDLDALIEALAPSLKAREGRDGRSGRDGTDGSAGESGPRGERGPMPQHEWKDTALRIQKADGSWGEPIELKGDAGRDGHSGRDGVDGKDGSQGQDGRQGMRGDAGKAGEIGPRGPIGPMPEHQWDATRLRFELAPNVWGKWTELRGPPGRGGGGGAIVVEQGLLRVGSIVWASTMSANFSSADSLKLTLTGDGAITLAGANDQQRVQMEIKQDGVGGHVLSFGPEVRYNTDLAAITLSSAASKTDRLAFIYDAAAGKYDLVAMMTGY